MATYFDGCTALANWAEEGWVSGTQFSIANPGDGNSISSGTSGSVEVLSSTLISADANRNNIELLVKQRRSATTTFNTTYRYTALVRGAGTSLATLTGYKIGWSSTNIRIARHNGDGTITAVASGTRTQAADTWYWFRFRANGTSLRLRVWQDGSAEPSTWDLDATDATYNTAGFAGLMSIDLVREVYTRPFGAGTNGDTAPASAGGGFKAAWARQRSAIIGAGVR